MDSAIHSKVLPQCGPWEDVEEVPITVVKLKVPYFSQTASFS